MSKPIIFKNPAPFVLESGEQLVDLEIAYHCYGELNEAKDNVIWVFHALTANSEVGHWWKGLVGKDCTIDPAKHFIVCTNTIGSIYGSTGPRSINPSTGAPYGVDFPNITVRDVVNAQLLLAKELKIDQIKLILGGSFGGSQALEFALLYPGKIGQMVVLASIAKETAWGIAIHEAQRLALKADQSFIENKSTSGEAGMMAARGIGLLTYRTHEAYIARQTDNDGRTHDFSAASYIRYQGEKLVKRFHAHCYWHLVNCLDTHNIGRHRGGVELALAQIHIPTLVIGISSDRLTPVAEQKFLAKHLAKGKYVEIDSDFGHDGFLIETVQIGKLIAEFMEG